MKVTLLEANEQVGGRCQSMDVTAPSGTFRFDTGPSLMLFPRTYHDTFASLGSPLEQHVEVKRVEPAAYRVWFEGGQQQPPSSLDLLYDVPAMITQLERVEAGAGRAALEVGTREFIDRDFDSLADFLDLRRLLPLLGQVDVMELLGQHWSRLGRRFRDPRLRALLCFQDLYVGLSPYTAPGVFSLLAATEVTDGVYYPVGGFQKVKEGLAAIARAAGVTIRTGARVARIELQPPASSSGEGRVRGVVLESGEALAADLVVSNVDVPFTYGLLGHTQYGAARQRRVTDQQYSAAVIAYNFCVRRRLDRLNHHNVFLSGQYEAAWQRATSPSTLLPHPNFYVHCPARTDPGAAPPGCDSVMVLLPVANMQEVQAAAKRNSGGSSSSGSGIRMGADGKPDYSALIDAGRAAIAATFKQAGVCGDFLSLVEREVVIDPGEWRRRYAIEHGAVFGLSHGLDQLALFRPAVRDPKVAGLYLVGASARPGNGVPLVMISARLAVQRAMQDVAAGVV